MTRSSRRGELLGSLPTNPQFLRGSGATFYPGESPMSERGAGPPYMRKTSLDRFGGILQWSPLWGLPCRSGGFRPPGPAKVVVLGRDGEGARRGIPDLLTSPAWWGSLPSSAVRIGPRPRGAWSDWCAMFGKTLARPAVHRPPGPQPPGQGLVPQDQPAHSRHHPLTVLAGERQHLRSPCLSAPGSSISWERSEVFPAMASSHGTAAAASPGLSAGGQQ